MTGVWCVCARALDSYCATPGASARFVLRCRGGLGRVPPAEGHGRAAVREEREGLVPKERPQEGVARGRKQPLEVGEERILVLRQEPAAVAAVVRHGPSVVPHRKEERVGTPRAAREGDDARRPGAHAHA